VTERLLISTAPDLTGYVVRDDDGYCYMHRGWRVLSSRAVEYDVGIRNDGKVGSVRAKAGKVVCVLQDPCNERCTFSCVLQYPDDFKVKRERVLLLR